jgi:hypothetical protein
VTSFSHPVWPLKGDPVSCGQAIFLSVATGSTIAFLCFSLALARAGTGILPSVSNGTLVTIGTAFGLLAYFVHRRSRIAALLLFMTCFGGAIVVPGIPAVVGIVAAIATFGALRATVILRPNTSLERT